MQNRKHWVRLGAAAAMGTLVLGSAVACSSDGGGGGDADSFPSETIEFVIAYAAGGSTDISVRMMADIAEETCGTTTVASNQTGGGGAVGFTATANAAPDGYTVGATATELSILHQLGLTEVKPSSLKGVARYALNPHVIYAQADSEWKTIEDVIAAIEAGETVTSSSAGSGSAGHLSMEGAMMAAGLPAGAVTNLPFDGDATALTALAGKQSDLTMMVAGTGDVQVQAGTVKPIAVAGAERLDIYPDVPTLQESGIDWESGAHLGLAVPAETPDDIAEKLADCLGEAIQSEEFESGMADLNFEVSYLPLKEFDAYLADLEERYGEVIEAAGL